ENNKNLEADNRDLSKRPEKCAGQKCPAPVAMTCPASTQTATPAPGCITAERQFPAQMYIASNDMQVRNVIWAVRAFLPLVRGPSTQPQCHMKITAARENDDTARALIKVASAVGCQTDYRQITDIVPEIEQEAM